MPNFSIPNNISPGDASDANKAMANWNQIVNDLNGGKIDATNTATSFAKDVVEPAFSSWKPIWTLGVYDWVPSTTNLLLKDAANGSALIALPRHLDPADVAAGSRTVQWRVKASFYTNQVAPAVTLTAFLGPAVLTAGASGAGNSYTAASVAARADLASPAASSSLHVEGSAISASAGHYLLVVVASGAATSGSLVDVRATLEYRQT